jgi:hypothetical protein
MMARTRLFLYALRVTFALGCSSPKPDATPSGPCPMGDLGAGATPEIAVVARTADGRSEPVAPGASLPLVEPPQGGQVVFVGVRARNIDGCGLLVTATLRDAASGRAVGVDARPVDLARAVDGWGETPSPDDISTYANVPVCPNPDAARALDGLPYVLEVSVKDRAGRTASATLDVVPSCAEPSLCPCECRAGADLGSSCASR